jgi:hypothetical protein
MTAELFASYRAGSKSGCRSVTICHGHIDIVIPWIHRPKAPGTKGGPTMGAPLRYAKLARELIPSFDDIVQTHSQ